MMQEKFVSCNHPSVKIGCRKQAFSQACAIRSPFLVSMSEIAMFRSLTQTVLQMLQLNHALG
jgi:hypothetical protein